MTRSLCAFAAWLLLTSAAAAGPMTADRQVAARAPAHGYVVSANLNKLVFWRLPEREDARARR